MSDTVTTTPRRGLVFTHRSIIDPADYSLPVREARKAPMRITAVRKSVVYFTYASQPANHGAFYMDRQEWEERYGASSTGRSSG